MGNPDWNRYNQRLAERDQQRRRDMEDWRREGVNGCALPPCGCLFSLAGVIATIIICCLGVQYFGNIQQECRSKGVSSCLSHVAHDARERLRRSGI